jgi:hypothetical protein
MLIMELGDQLEKLLSNKRASVVSSFNTQSSIKSVQTGVE